MKQTLFSALFILCLVGCTKESHEIPQTPSSKKSSLDLKQYKAPFEVNANQARNRSNCYWTSIDANSTNALKTAIDNICEGGVIYLRAGLHTQNEVLTITKQVKIIGEQGAILKINSNLTPYNNDFLQPIQPGIHIQNTAGVLIQDLEIQAIDGEGGTAILIENSPYTGIMRNAIPNFQYAVLNLESDFTTMMFNTIVASSAWLSGDVEEVNSIILASGKSCYIADNEVSNATVGVWACSSYGTYERNNTHDNYIGLLLCNAPVYFLLPSGEVKGSDNPATAWKARNNSSSNNQHVGYLVIDGAHQNILENNEASANGDYDIELASESDRFAGILVPEAYDNTVRVGVYQDIKIKVCGTNNSTDGGVIVDNGLEPCN